MENNHGNERRQSGPAVALMAHGGGAGDSPVAVAVAEEDFNFGHHAGRVLARRNRRDLALAGAEGCSRRGLALMRRVGRRQARQFELLAARPALRSSSEEGRVG